MLSHKLAFNLLTQQGKMLISGQNPHLHFYTLFYIFCVATTWMLLNVFICIFFYQVELFWFYLVLLSLSYTV